MKQNLAPFILISRKWPHNTKHPQTVLGTTFLTTVALFHTVTHKIGDDKTTFWNDQWISDKPLSCHSGLNTYVRLQKRNPWAYLSPNWSSLCKETGETQSHIFIHCSFPRKLWADVLVSFRWSIAPPAKSHEWLHLLLIDHPSKSTKRTLWSFIVMVVLGKIQNERNSRIFQSRESSSMEILEATLFYALY